MMKNTLEDLSNYLFEQIERINDDELDDKQLNKELKKASAMSSLASNIIQGTKVQIDGAKAAIDYGFVDRNSRGKLPLALGYGKENK